MNLLRRRLTAAMAASMFCASCLPVANADPVFPRLATVQYAGPFLDYADPDYRAALARTDLVILNTWPGLAPAGQSMESIVHDIKVKNADAKVFLYAKEDNLGTEAAIGDAWNAFRTKIDTMHWWVYPTGSSGTPVASDSGSSYPAINTTLYTPADSNGDKAVDWMTKFFVNQLAVPSMDGFFMDDMFRQTRVTGDWNRDNTSDAAHDPTAAGWLRDGWAHYVSLVRQLMPGKTQIGNIADWGDAGGDITGFQGILDGGLLEGAIGKTWSWEAQEGWQSMMLWYRKGMAALGGAKLGIFNQWGNPTIQKDFRYGYASSLMDDAYYSFTNEATQYHDVDWFDEFDAQLGAAISPPPPVPNGAWQSGVYRRDFVNGIALVNPKGNGVRTVTLEADFVKLTANTSAVDTPYLKYHHDTVVNNGATVHTVTLQDRDGIILLRKGKTFGQTTVGAVPSGGMSADMKRGSKFSLAEAGTLTSFSAYLDGAGGASGTQSVRIVLYQDASGTPGAKLAESSVVNITSGAAGSWVNFSAPNVALAPGSYWLAIHTGGTSGVARNAGDGVTPNNWFANNDTFSDGASNPFGAGNFGTGTLSVFASYLPGTQKQFGTVTPGTMPSAGMSADFKRASKYTLGETGTLLSLSAYLDGNGATSGSQSVRLALYRDLNGAPDAKVAESGTVTINAGTAPGWVTFPAPQLSLTPGAYWVAIQTGSTAGVARDYTDGSSATNWFANADAFSDGASNPFGSGSLGTQNLSVRVNYLH